MKTIMKTILRLSLSIAALLVLTACPRPSPPGPGPIVSGRSGNVHGSVHAVLGKQQIMLTDFQVVLRDKNTQKDSAPATTDRYGRYYFRNQPDGDYQLCWNTPGWVASCAEQTIYVRGNISFAQSQGVTPQQVNGGAGPLARAVWGRVTLADGSSPWFKDAYFGVRQDVSVTVQGAQGINMTANTNAHGEFVIPVVPLTPTPITLAAQAGGGAVSMALAANQGSNLTLTIPNHRPSLVGITAYLNNQARHEVPQNALLNVRTEVRDVDGDTVTLTWKAAPETGTLLNTSGAITDWQLPDRMGMKTLYVLAQDGKGGITLGSTSVSAGADTSDFLIKLVNPSGTIVTNAKVFVNGKPANLLPKGLFVGTAPVTNRYVVNVYAPGYVFVSRIYGHGGIYHEVKLAPAAIANNLNADTDIKLVDTRKDLRQYGYIETAPASIFIKAGSLVDGKGNKPGSPLTGEVAALDVSSEQFPGDNGAMVDGRDIGLISYGSMYTELRDAAGNRMQLKPGAAAEVVIPVPYQMLSQGHVSPSIPLWYYNEQTGFWEKLPNGATYDAGKRAYIGKVTHLSAFNVDLEQTDLACFRVLLDNVQVGQLQAKVTSVSGQPFPATPFFDIHDQLNVIKRLPPNSTVHLEVHKNDGTAVTGLLLLDENQVVQASGNFPTGAASNPHFPDPPYSNCKTVSVRVNTGSNVNAVSFLDMYGDTGDAAHAQGYYLHLDPTMTHSGSGYSGGNHSTLGTWWNYAGFTNVVAGKPNTATGESHQAYLNFNDLGFGRDMHIHKDGTSVYAYVTNYSDTAVPDQNPHNANYANTQNASKAIATVAMEASNFGGMTKVVQFYVFAGADASAPLVDGADLDGFGVKFVPQLCQICHGGNPYAPANAAAPTDLEAALRTNTGAKGSVLREFDLSTFVYPGDTAPGNVAGLSATALSDFYNLNHLVLDAGTQPVMVDLITGFNPNPATFNANYAPTSWKDSGVKQDLYTNVVGKSCRTCHVAFDPTSYLSSLNWEDYDQFKARRFSINLEVCGSSKSMPHALMTFRNFWLGSLGGPYEPPKLASFNGPGWSPLGTCQ